METETTALLARMTTQPSAARATAIDTFIVRLKTASIWTTLDCLWIMAAHNAQAAALNWISSSFPLTPAGSPAFEADRGWQLTGSSYLSTGFNPSTAPSPKFVQDSACGGVFSLTDNQVQGFDLAAHTTGSTIAFRFGSRWDGTNQCFCHANNVDAALFAPSRSCGHIALCRYDSGNSFYYRHGFPPVTSIVRASTGVPNDTFLIGAATVVTLGSFTSRQYAAAHIGSELTESQLAVLSAAIEEYLASMAEGWDVLVYAGQSNQQSGGYLSIGTDSPSLNVWQMRDDDTAGIAIDPLDYPSKSEDFLTGTPRIGHALTFARDYYGPNRLTTGRRVLIVPVAKNGLGLVGAGLAVNGTYYNETIRRANLAMLMPNARFIGIFWLQGETDALNSVSGVAYQSALDLMFAGLRDEITGASECKIIVTGMSRQWINDSVQSSGGTYGTRTADDIDAVHQDTPNRIAHCRYSDTSAITTTDPTYLHYDAIGQRLIALADWTAFQTIVNNEVDPYTTTFVPGVPWDRVTLEWNVPRGSGVPFQFEADPTQSVIDSDYVATVYLWDGTQVEFSVSGGNMTVNEATGVVTANPTYSQTVLWQGVALLNLWQTGAGDDNRTLLKQVRLLMYAGGSPA